MITDHIHRIRDSVRLHPQDTRRFHEEMEARKKARTEELRSEVAASKKPARKGKLKNAPR